MKKLAMIFFAAVALCLVFCTAPDAEAATVASGTCGDKGKNVTWVLDDQGTITISGSGRMYNYSSSEAKPWDSYKDSIKAVVITDGVTWIGHRAFQSCKNLKTLTMADSVEVIGYYSLSYSGLTQLDIPDSVEEIQTYALAGCTNLTSVVIPGNVKELGSYAFENCTNLKAVTIQEGVEWSEHYTFSNCAKLEHIVLPESFIYPAQYMFSGCTSLKTAVLPSTLTKIPGSMFAGCSSLTAIVIPEGVTNIMDSAFKGCSSLTTLTIPDKVERIESNAFSGCSKLTEVTMGTGVKMVWNNAFYKCENIEKVHIRDLAAWCAIDFKEDDSNPVFYAENFYVDGQRVTKLVIPAGVTRVNAYTFVNCNDLTSVTIPDGVESIEGNAFYRCPKVRKIIFEGAAPDNLNSGIDLWTSEVIACYYPANETSWEAAKASVYSWKASWIPYEGTPPVENFDIDVSRMILGNALEFQFGVEKSKILNLNSSYAVVEKQWADGTVTQKNIPGTQWQTVGPYYAIVYDGLAAKEMADTITVTIYDSFGEPISNSKSDSARDYVSRAFDGQSPEGKTMMVDMLNYGAAAQGSFGYGVDDLANSKLTEAQKACGTATAAATRNAQVKGLHYKGTRLVLESRIQMQVAFEGMNTNMYAYYSFTDHSGKQREIIVPGKDFISVGNLYGIELSELVYADARSLVKIQIFNKNGVLYAGGKDSIESYINRSGATDPLYDALIKFTDSAKAYLH